MSCVSYFNPSITDQIHCNGMKPSNKQNRLRTDLEKRCLAIGTDSWKNDWRNGRCQEMFNSMVFPEGTYSKTGFANAVSDYNDMFYSYYGPYHPDTNPNGGHIIDDSDEVSKLLIESCSKTQGVCQCAAYNMCNSCKSYEVYESTLTKKLCGCASQSSISNVYGVDQYCEPPCAGRDTSKQRNFQTGIVKSCKQKVCFVDKPEVFVFSNDCPHCNENECLCVSVNELPSNIRRRCRDDSIVLRDRYTEPSIYPIFGFFLIIITFVFAVIITGMEPTTETITTLNQNNTMNQAADRNIPITNEPALKSLPIDSAFLSSNLSNLIREKPKMTGSSRSPELPESKTVDLYSFPKSMILK